MPHLGRGCAIGVGIFDGRPPTICLAGQAKPGEASPMDCTPMKAVEISQALLPAWYLLRDGFDEAEKEDSTIGEGFLGNRGSGICSQCQGVVAQYTPFQSRLPESKVNNLLSPVRILCHFNPLELTPNSTSVTFLYLYFSFPSHSPFPLSPSFLSQVK